MFRSDIFLSRELFLLFDLTLFFEVTCERFNERGTKEREKDLNRGVGCITFIRTTIVYLYVIFEVFTFFFN